MKAHKGKTLEEFTSEINYPFLMFHSEEQLMDDTGKFITIKMVATNVEDPATLYPYVVEIVKAEESRSQAFPLIFLGRTRNNDIQVKLPFISKLHCYFKLMPDGTTLVTDGGSTNGTMVDGKPLQRRYSFPLKGGEEIIFGGKLKATFLHPDALWEALKLGGSD